VAAFKRLLAAHTDLQPSTKEQAMTYTHPVMIDLKLSDPNHALREALFNILIVTCDNVKIYPDGLDKELYPLVTVANVRAAANVLMELTSFAAAITDARPPTTDKE
jgi:hypothetical protein